LSPFSGTICPPKKARNQDRSPSHFKTGIRYAEVEWKNGGLSVMLGSWRTARAVLPHIIEARGYILFVSSLSGTI